MAVLYEFRVRFYALEATLLKDSYPALLKLIQFSQARVATRYDICLSYYPFFLACFSAKINLVPTGHIFQSFQLNISLTRAHLISGRSRDLHAMSRISGTPFVRSIIVTGCMKM